MDEIIMVKKGIEPTIYYRHVCSICESTLDIKESITSFKCLECQNDEICTQQPSAMIKKYFKNDTKISLSKQSSKKKFGKNK